MNFEANRHISKNLQFSGQKLFDLNLFKMETSKIFNNDYILEKILRYVKKRKNAALVCQDFYKAVCKVEKFHFRIKIAVSWIASMV